MYINIFFYKKGDIYNLYLKKELYLRLFMKYNKFKIKLLCRFSLKLMKILEKNKNLLFYRILGVMVKLTNIN